MVLIPFLAGVITTFCVNLYGNSLLNNLTVILLFGFILIVFKVPVLKGLAYWIFYVVIMIYSEMTTVCINYFEKMVSPYTDYSFLVDSPSSTMIMFILKYIPVLVCKQLFSKDIIKMKRKTFLFYLIIPILNVICISLVCTFEFYSNNAYIRLITSLYALFSCIGSYTIFYSFQRHTNEIRKEYDLLENQMKSVSENELLYLSAKAMRNRLMAAEEKVETERIIRHDRRHFEAMLYELLENNNVDKAKELLKDRLSVEPAKMRRWCDNETINATIEYYVKKAESLDIKTDVSLNIPKELSVDSLQLAIALSNLIENAIHANEKLPEEERFINMKAVCKRQLLISIANACADGIKLNENGLPFTEKEGHGIGTKSVLAFAEQNNSEVVYCVENNVFTTQLMIQL